MWSRPGAGSPVLLESATKREDQARSMFSFARLRRYVERVDVPAELPRGGLTSAEVAARVAAAKTNAFSPDSSRSAWSIIRANVFTLFNGIVFACFIVLFVLGRWQDALFGFAAIANAIIGSTQEFRAKAALDRLALLNKPSARVRREGIESDVPSGAVVLDDLLILRAGDQVPADARVIEARDLQVDESMLTGEADAVDKGSSDEVLSGSAVVGGGGIAQVTRVGADSYANRFSTEARRFSLVSSELRTSINKVLKWVGWGIGPIGLLVFDAQVMVAGGYRMAIVTGSWVQAVVNTVAAVTAMIPLGLVLMTSIAFAVGAARLANRRVLVNELPAVEGLARIDVICLDKTGTLTVGEIAFDAALPWALAVDGWQRALSWFAAAPDANATARALLPTFPPPASDESTGYTPFSSARKWSAVSFRGIPGTWVMGAPEMMFATGAMDPTTELGRTIGDLADTGRRTLLLAHTDESLSEADVECERLPEGLEPAVILTFREQVRPDAAQTLAYFRTQGVGIRIISGDHPRTVAAIAREVGIDATVGFDARELPDDDEEFADILERDHVFGRVTPEQKQRMVIALQSRGHAVAMTGDGVNDALAIKTADIGIAMNSGSPATKAVARLVLVDGQFSHLPDVVAEGRQVIANIERVSMLFLTKTAYATGLAILFGLLVLEFPFLPRQLSITDGLTIGIPAFFLALMPTTQRYTPGFLKRSLSFALPAGIIIALGLTWYTLVAQSMGVSVEQLRTGATIILAVVGIWVLTAVSRPLNRFKVLVIGGMFVALLAIFTIPAVRDFFALVDPGQELAVALAGIAAVMIAGIEIVRFLHQRLPASVLAPTTSAPLPSGPGNARGEAIVRGIVVVLIYASGLIATVLGILILLSRYGEEDPSDVVRVSLVGAGIALFGLLLIAAGGGVRRGSRLSRVLVTLYLSALIILNVLDIASNDVWGWESITTIAMASVIVLSLWTPPVARTFRRARAPEGTPGDL